MKTIFIYTDDCNIVKNISLKKIDILDLIQYIVPINHDNSINKLYETLLSGSTISNKPYILLQNEKSGKYYIKPIIFGYFNNDGIKSISPIKVTEFDNDSDIELGILLFDDTIKSILKGDHSLSLFSVKRKDKFLIELEKQELNKPKYPTLFNTYKMELNNVDQLKKCKFNDIHFCYYRNYNKLEVHYNKTNQNILNMHKWVYITKKNDYTILLNSFILSFPPKQEKITINDVNIPKDFDIYSNFGIALSFYFKEIK